MEYVQVTITDKDGIVLNIIKVLMDDEDVNAGHLGNKIERVIEDHFEVTERSSPA